MTLFVWLKCSNVNRKSYFNEQISLGTARNIVGRALCYGLVIYLLIEARWFLTSSRALFHAFSKLLRNRTTGP